MQMPKDYNETVIGMTLTPGGHKCVIKQVEETKSRNGSDMLIVSIDTDKTDKQPGFYAERYLADKAAGKDPVWRGRQFVVTSGEYGTANLKRFVTAVEDSNEGFEVKWGKGFADCFKGQKVGVVFRIEEYTDEGSGELRTFVKPFRFCDYAKAEEQAVPKRKEAPAPQPSLQQTWQEQAQEGFMTIPDNLEDDGLPFH